MFVAACYFGVKLVDRMWGNDPLSPFAVRAPSGLTRAFVQVPTGPDGLTVEQRNIARRFEEDNRPGAIKHLYVLSPISGQLILYSTVRGKVTSSGKRAAPATVSTDDYRKVWGNPHMWEDGNCTGERAQDDGTYGSPVESIYWWDVNGVHHEHFLTSEQIILVRSRPLPNPPEVILNWM